MNCSVSFIFMSTIILVFSFGHWRGCDWVQLNNWHNSQSMLLFWYAFLKFSLARTVFDRKLNKSSLNCLLNLPSNRYSEVSKSEFLIFQDIGLSTLQLVFLQHLWTFALGLMHFPYLTVWCWTGFCLLLEDLLNSSNRRQFLGLIYFVLRRP